MSRSQRTSRVRLWHFTFTLLRQGLSLDQELGRQRQDQGSSVPTLLSPRGLGAPVTPGVIRGCCSQGSQQVLLLPGEPSHLHPKEAWGGGDAGVQDNSQPSQHCPIKPFLAAQFSIWGSPHPSNPFPPAAPVVTRVESSGVPNIFLEP